MFKLIWLDPLLPLPLEMPEREAQLIVEVVSRLQIFPDMFSVIETPSTFKGCRACVAGHWTVYYRRVGNEVFIRGLWDDRFPPID
jgi:hypothetical protein